MEIELEIGFPTDVKHVTHIGYDGSMTTNPVKNWEKIETPEILSFPCISLKQFENAMAAQSETLVAWITTSIHFPNIRIRPVNWERDYNDCEEMYSIGGKEQWSGLEWFFFFFWVVFTNTRSDFCVANLTC